MSQVRKWGLFLLVSLLALIALVFTSGPGAARGSVLSQGAGGWLAARRYLEAREAQVKLLDRPLDQLQDKGVLVVAFPWQVGTFGDPGEALTQHLRRGGDLVLAYSGGLSSLAELLAFDALTGDLEEIRTPPLQPARWRRFVHEEWTLRPAPAKSATEEWTAARPLRVWAPRAIPEPPKEAQVLFQGPVGEAAVFAFRRYGGRVVVLPADLFSNARLADEGNADLLETLLRDLGPSWTFDEYHHGLARQGEIEGPVSGPVLDLLLAHLAVLYLLAVWALARRFGPAWREVPAIAGSTASFLLGLGALHHRLGHHRDAALLLVRRTGELHRDLAVPEELTRRAQAPEVMDADGLVSIARSLVRLRRGRPPVPDPTENRP
ncbi:MAG TPA: DUF4350 domain-containing protein [Thermoanaerobaculia bacterium]|nr:DUF4350 domain-containing protein [Thermoanaerobaculia bacterium]